MFGDVIFFFGAILLLMSIFMSILLHRKPKNLPPGEWGLPIVGYVPYMSWKISSTLRKLQRKHGDIFTLKVGSQVWIFLSDYNFIKSAFQKLEFSGRPFVYHFNVMKKYHNKGIIHSDTEVWTLNRRFALRSLRDFGFGKTPVLEEAINTEVSSLVQNLKQDVNKPIEVDWNVNVAVLNVIWRLVANRHYDIADKEISKFAANVNDLVVDTEGPMAIFTVFPWLIPLVPNYVKKKWMREAAVERNRDEIFHLLETIIKEHKEKLDPKNPKDLIDKFLIESEEQKHNPDYQHWDDINVLVNVYDFFLAGSETTSSTLRWFFLYMAKYPHVQKQVQKEIDEIVPKGQKIFLQDKDKLPLLEALSFETNRFISLFPNSLPHKVNENSVLEGYDIPKGTWVMMNSEICHRNPKYWKHPNDFCLENFLDENGKAIRNKEGYLPFSIGRRVCPGESLANMELFAFMGAILQNFEISEPVGQDASLTPDENVNLFNYPSKFKIILKPRN